MTGDHRTWKLTASEMPDGVHIQLSGDLDMTRTGLVDEALTYLRPAARTLTLDLAGVGFCDSTGINILVQLRRAALSAGWQLRTINCQPQVRRVFDLTGLVEHLNIIDPGRPSR